MTCGAIAGLLFVGFGLFGLALVSAAGGNAPAEWELIGTMITGGALLVGVMLVVWNVVQWRRFAAAPLVVVPALVLDKRLNVWGGGQNTSAQTNYYVTLELRDGRQEFDVTDKLYGLVGRDDTSAAWIKGGHLPDFRHLSAVEQAPARARRRTIVQTGPVAESATDAGGSPALSLEAVTGPFQGQRIVVKTTPFVIGDDHDNDLGASSDQFLSGRHAALRFDGGRWLLSDEASTTGTFVDGRKLGSDEEHSVRHGELIRLGASEFRVVLGDAASEHRRTTLR